MKQQKGFTLVELIIVILILGILAVTAAPRFLSFGTEARVGTLEGVQASARGAAELTFGKATIRGIERLGLTATDEYQDVDGIEVLYGYPAPSEGGIEAVLNLSAGDWQVFFDEDDTTATAAKIAPTFAVTNRGDQDVPADFDNLAACYVLYTAAADDETPYTATIVSSGC